MKFVIIFLIFVAVYYIVTKISIKKQKALNKNAETAVYIHSAGYVELENAYRYKKMDCQLKYHFGDKLINWKATEDVTLHWKGPHVIEVYLVNGGYKKICVTVSDVVDETFDIKENVQEKSKEKPTEPELTSKKKAELWVSEQMEKFMDMMKGKTSVTVTELPSELTAEEIIKAMVKTGAFSAVREVDEGIELFLY